ncbi:hypothetical protein UNH65_10055 [Chitinophaga sp. 180180018-2]|nr:hypothetical protein [Chitinophaga sp. 212800010-3]
MVGFLSDGHWGRKWENEETKISHGQGLPRSQRLRLVEDNHNDRLTTKSDHRSGDLVDWL